MTIIIFTFQSHFKSEQNQVKWNKIMWDMWKSDSIFSYLQSSALLQWLLKFVSWQGLLLKETENI